VTRKLDTVAVVVSAVRGSSVPVSKDQPVFRCA
jgi:hypothetical protein